METPPIHLGVHKDYFFGDMKNFIKNSLFPHVKSDTLMTQADSIRDAFQTMQEKYENPTFRLKLQDYSKTIKFIFTDLQDPYIIAIHQGNITDLSNKNITTPDIEITTESTLFLDILHKKISPMMAYSTGKMKVKGKLTDLMQLQELL